MYLACQPQSTFVLTPLCTYSEDILTHTYSLYALACPWTSDASPGHLYQDNSPLYPLRSHSPCHPPSTCPVTSLVWFSTDFPALSRPLAWSRHLECVCWFNAHNWTHYSPTPNPNTLSLSLSLNSASISCVVSLIEWHPPSSLPYLLSCPAPPCFFFCSPSSLLKSVFCVFWVQFFSFTQNTTALVLGFRVSHLDCGQILHPSNLVFSDPFFILLPD